MSTLLPPLAPLSAEDDGPAVVAVAYVLIVITILFAGIRIITTFALKRGLGLDDMYLVVAAVAALAQTILSEKSVDNGLGRSIDSLSADGLNKYYRFSYAASLVAIVAMACAKLSVVNLMRRLTSQQPNSRRIYLALSLIVMAWTIFALGGLAFQCPTPFYVYRPDSCAGHGAIWYPIIIGNILTDAVLAFIFAPRLWNVNMRVSQRITVISLFGARILVCGAATAQIALLTPARTSADQTKDMVVPVILQECVMNLSILAAAMPSLHRFLGELQSGRLGAQIQPHETDYELSHESKSRPKSFRAGLVNSANKLRDQITSKEEKPTSFQASSDTRFRPDLVGEYESNIAHEPPTREETGSRTSDGSERMIIRHTVGWDVQQYARSAGSARSARSARQSPTRELEDGHPDPESSVPHAM